jgi:hypothetical protein
MSAKTVILATFRILLDPAPVLLVLQVMHNQCLGQCLATRAPKERKLLISALHLAISVPQVRFLISKAIRNANYVIVECFHPVPGMKRVTLVPWARFLMFSVHLPAKVVRKARIHPFWERSSARCVRTVLSRPVLALLLVNFAQLDRLRVV